MDKHTFTVAFCLIVTSSAACPTLMHNAGKPDSVLAMNLGVGGRNSSEGLVAFPAQLASCPDHIVIFYGLNDALNSTKVVPLPTFTRNLTDMVHLAETAGVRSIFLVGLHPVNVGYVAERHLNHPQITRLQEHLAEYNATVAQVAADTAATFIDWRADFLAASPGTSIDEATENNAASLLRCELNSGARDGIHLTISGNRFLGETVLAALEDAVVTGDRILCIGDSVTYGVHVVGEGTATGETYPAVLATGLLSIQGEP